MCGCEKYVESVVIKMSKEANGKKSTLIGRIVCIVVIVLFLPLLIVNLTLIIKGMANPDTPPDIFGYMPLAVLSGSMDDGSDDCIKVNDMIFVKKADPQTFEKGDIITFRYGDDVITHRIVEVIKEDDKIVSFSTKGDANNTTDGLIPVEKVYGIYERRIGGLGGFAIFLQTPTGIVIFAGIPILAFVAIEVMGFVQSKRRVATADEKDAEIARLRAMVAEKSESSDDDRKDKED